MARTKRVFTDHHKAELLAKVRAWRWECSRVQARAPILGDVYRAVSCVMDAIDGVAEVVTGDREHFLTKQPSIGEGPNRARSDTKEGPGR